MKRISAFFYALIASPKRDMRAIAEKLDTLKKEMEEIAKMENKVQAIVRLFQVISPLQDEGGFSQTYHRLMKKNYGQLDEVIKAIEVLQKHFKNAGARNASFNRTSRGERVTAAGVYLGEVWGIWCKPASYWLENRKRFEQEDAGVDPKEGSGRKFISVWYCINDYQCKPFVDGHTAGILRQITVLKKAM